MNNNEITLIRFTKDWIEEYLDLIEQDDSTDPLYSKQYSREATKKKILSRLKSNLFVVESEFLAIQKRRVIGSSRAAVLPTCGDLEQKTATLTLTVAPTHRGLGIGSRLLKEICKDIYSQGIEWIEIAILDAWKDWQRFLKKHGFAPSERFADAVLKADVLMNIKLQKTNEIIRPIRLPEDKEQVLELYNKERANDLLKACAILAGQPAWWEIEPWSRYFDAETFLVAEDKDTRKLVGYISAVIIPDENPWGLIDYIDVVKKLVETSLGERLLVQVIETLRKKGASDIRTRIHFGYRNEAELFQQFGFKIENSATVWCRSIIR